MRNVPPCISSTTTPSAEAGLRFGIEAERPHHAGIVGAQQAVADALGVGVAGVRDRGGEDEQRVVGLGRELVRVALVFRAERGDERLVGRVRLADEPRAADDQPVRRRAGDLAELGRVRAVAADEQGFLPETQLPRLQQHARHRLDESGNADRIGLQRLDLGELRGEVGVLAAEAFGRQNLQPGAGRRGLHHLEPGFREGVVVRIHQRDRLHPARDRFLSSSPGSRRLPAARCGR